MDKNPLRQLGTVYQVRKKQMVTFFIVVAIVLIFLWGVYSLLTSSDVANSGNKRDKTTSLNMADPLTHVNESSIWVERTQNSLAKEQKATDLLQQQLQMLTQEKTAQAQSSKIQSEQVQALQNQISQLEEKLTRSLSNVNTAGSISFEGTGTRVAGLNEDVLSLSAQNTAIKSPQVSSKTSDTYVPAGTFVRAALLGGADASAGVTSQGNPTPMLLRILDQGTLPNHQKSHLKGCTAIAAVVGDISSERGQIRLERLSCVSPNGAIVDIPVEGTIFGPEGKNGVRGVPLWREGALLKRAFAAGALSGLSSGISQQYTTTSVSPLGSTSNIQGTDIFKYGAATGVSQAMEKIADYNIRRADQYHPVIQISAGTVVDLVFLKGFFLDGEKHEETKKEGVLSSFGFSTKPTHNPLNVSSNIGKLSQLPLSQQQINAIKAKTAHQDSL